MAPKKPTSPETGGSSQGPSTDAAGTPVVDPTTNVYKLVDAVEGRLQDVMDAGFKRMDDLREADSKRVHDLMEAKEHDHRRLDELMDVKVNYIEKMNGMRDLHSIELREAESARLNAIRAVDVAAVSQASEVAAAQASILAQQVSTSAETIRVQMSSAAEAAATSLRSVLAPMQQSIDDLRRAQYEQQGKQQPNPESAALAGIMDRLARMEAAKVGGQDSTIEARAVAARQDEIKEAMKHLELQIANIAAEKRGGQTQVTEDQARGGNTGMWIGLAVGAVGLVMSLLFSIVGIVITLILANR